MHRFLLWQIVKFPFMKIDWYDATLRRPSAFYDPLIHYNFKQRALSKYLVSCLFAAEGEEESKLFFKIIFFSNQQIWELFIIQWVRFLGCAGGACWWSLVPDPWWCWLLPPWPAPCSPLPATDCPPPAEPEISCRSRDGGAAQRPTLPPVAGTEASGGDRCVCQRLLHFSISFLSTNVCHCLPETYLSNLLR